MVRRPEGIAKRYLNTIVSQKATGWSSGYLKGKKCKICITSQCGVLSSDVNSSSFLEGLGVMVSVECCVWVVSVAKLCVGYGFC